MRHNDFHALAPDGIPFPHTPWALPPHHAAHPHQRASAQVCGDFVDDAANSWESAWIDLGGEG